MFAHFSRSRIDVNLKITSLQSFVEKSSPEVPVKKLPMLLNKLKLTHTAPKKSIPY